MEKDKRKEKEIEIETKTVKQQKLCCDNKHNGGFGAFILITVGALLLLNNFNVLPWEIWHNLWKFWPVLLIVAGVETIFGRSWLGNLIATIFGLSISWIIISNVLSLTVPEFNSWLTQNAPWSKVPVLQQFLIEKGVTDK